MQCSELRKSISGQYFKIIYIAYILTRSLENICTTFHPPTCFERFKHDSGTNRHVFFRAILILKKVV